MGTSMYLHVEKRVGDKWIYVHAPQKPPQVADRTTPPIDWYMSMHYQCYEDMAVLAGVRNYDGIKPITKWRGLPTDASAELLAAKEWACETGGHWVTLAEIKAYDYNQQISVPVKWYSAEMLAKRGWKTEPFLDIRRHKKLCGKDGVPSGVPEGYTLKSFPVREFVGFFLDVFLPTVEQACQTEPENIRLVMWFDS